jgi:hypothetical protein
MNNCNGIADAVSLIETNQAAVRSARALLLGIDIETLMRRDNRAFNIGQIAKEQGCSWDEAERLFDEMAMQAKAKAEQGVEVCPDCEKASKFGVRCRDCETAREDADLRGERQ